MTHNAALAAVLAAALALAACSESGSGGDASVDADTAAQPDAAQGAERDDEAAAAETATVMVDPEAYAGLFGDEADPEAMRGTFFVLPAAPPPMAERFPDLPDGAIMIGAVWGDVAPWYLVPVSETRFEQTLVSDFQDAPLVADFELDADGNAIAVTFSGMFADFGRRVRVGDVPEEWR